MCGRTACTLGKCDISCATAYLNLQGKLTKPQWVTKGSKYTTSYNLAPSCVSPVLVSLSSHFETEITDTDRVLCGMKWGFNPVWQKTGQLLSNCRAETIKTTQTFSGPLKKGQRCVVLADGFYEWQKDPKTKKNKQTYFAYLKQNSIKSWEDYTEPRFNDTKGWLGPKLLTMAALFDCKDNEYTYSVVTVEAHDMFKHIHHRMPAMLTSPDEVTQWLDYTNVPVDTAVSLLRPTDCLTWHPVSNYVNNSRNNGKQCMTPYEPSAALKGVNPITKWLTPIKRIKDDDDRNDNEHATEKKPKVV